MNRHPPFGNQIRDAVALLPHYKLDLNQVSSHNKHAHVHADCMHVRTGLYITPMNVLVLIGIGCWWGQE